MGYPADLPCCVECQRSSLSNVSAWRWQLKFQNHNPVIAVQQQEVLSRVSSWSPADCQHTSLLSSQFTPKPGPPCGYGGRLARRPFTEHMQVGLGLDAPTQYMVSVNRTPQPLGQLSAQQRPSHLLHTCLWCNTTRQGPGQDCMASAALPHPRNPSAPAHCMHQACGHTPLGVATTSASTHWRWQVTPYFSTAQHNTARHGKAQHSMAQHSTA